jgi:hypothetical protein
MQDIPTDTKSRAPSSRVLQEAIQQHPQSGSGRPEISCTAMTAGMSPGSDEPIGNWLSGPTAHARGGRRRSWNQARYLLIFSRWAVGA